MDYGQMFEMLQLDYLPGDEDDIDIHGKAVIEYFNWIQGIACGVYGSDNPEVEFGCSILRTFLREFGEGYDDYKKPVFKALANVEWGYHLLRLAIPLLPYMWM
jgi:hypothetical protein